MRRSATGAQLCKKCLLKARHAEDDENCGNAMAEPRHRGTCMSCHQDRCLHYDSRSSRQLCAFCMMNGLSSQSSSSLRSTSEVFAAHSSSLRRKCSAFAAFTAQARQHYSGQHKARQTIPYATPVERTPSVEKSLSQSWSASSLLQFAPRKKKTAWPEPDAVPEPPVHQPRKSRRPQSWSFGGGVNKVVQDADGGARRRRKPSPIAATKLGNGQRSGRQIAEGRIASKTDGATPQSPLELPPLLPILRDDLAAPPLPPPAPHLGVSFSQKVPVPVGPTFRSLREMNIARCS